MTGLSNLIVTGDFNFPHVNWNTCCPTRSDVGTEDFCNILNHHFLLQLRANVSNDQTNSQNRGKPRKIDFAQTL